MEFHKLLLVLVFLDGVSTSASELVDVLDYQDFVLEHIVARTDYSVEGIREDTHKKSGCLSGRTPKGTPQPLDLIGS